VFDVITLVMSTVTALLSMGILAVLRRLARRIGVAEAVRRHPAHLSIVRQREGE
jgi:hypothetical protein